MESLVEDAPLVVAKWKKERKKKKRFLPREKVIARARTSTLWLSGEGDQKVESRSVRKGIREGIRQFTDVRRNWFRGDRNYFFRKSRFSRSLPSALPAFSLFVLIPRFFGSSRRDVTLGYRILPACSVTANLSFGRGTALGIVDCTETEVTFSNFSRYWVRDTILFSYLISFHCCVTKKICITIKRV